MTRLLCVSLSTRLASASLALLVLLTAGPAAARERHPAGLPDGVDRPDIVVLLLDDLPEIDDRIWRRLPTINRLFLDGGARFTDVVGNDPLCCPGRANLLTGQWTLHHGVAYNDGRLFDPRVTIATELQGAGYWTGIFGKYFNATDKLVDPFPDGWDVAWIHAGSYWGYRAWWNGLAVRYGRAADDYSTRVMRLRARTALAKVPATRPVFLWLAPFAVHSGFDQAGVIDRHEPAVLPVDRGAPACADIEDWSTAAFTDPDMATKPAYLQGLAPVGPKRLVKTCESLLSVDRALEAVLAGFRRAGRPEPMIVLTADNGMAWGAHGWRNKQVPYATPVPLFIRWTALLGEAPVTVATTLTNVDLAPTLCAIAGCEMGPFPNGHDVDGISFLPLLLDVGAVNRGAKPGERRRIAGGVRRTRSGRIAGLSLGREVVFEEHTMPEGPRLPSWTGLRTTNESPIGRWVWTEYASGETELYRLSGGPCWTWRVGDPGDPCQLTNLADDPEHAETRAVLEATLAARGQTPLRLRGLRR